MTIILDDRAHLPTLLLLFRMNMTDVMVQDLLKDLRVRIKCRDVVKKLAIFKENLAVSQWIREFGSNRCLSETCAGISGANYWWRSSISSEP